jgi:hypothetical protein
LTAAAAHGQRLTRLLHSIGVRYALRRTADDVPYAGFRVELPGSEPCSLTAIVRDQALQFTCHEALCVPARDEDLWRLNLVNLEWGLGHVYYRAEASCYQASASVYLPAGADPSFEARRSLDSLLLCVSYLRRYPRSLSGIEPAAGGEAPEASFRSFLAGELLDLPGVPGGDALHDVDAALIEAGFHFEYVNGGRGLAQKLAAPGGPPVVVELYKHEARLLWLRAWPQATTGPVPPDIHAIQRRNSSLPFGAICVWRDRRQSIYRAAVPLAQVEIDARLLRYVVRQAMTALGRR